MFPLRTINQKVDSASANWVPQSSTPVSATTDSPHQEQHSTDPSPVSETVCQSLLIQIMPVQSPLLTAAPPRVANPVSVLQVLFALYSVVVLADPVSWAVSAASVSLFRIFYTIESHIIQPCSNRRGDHMRWIGNA